MPRVLLSTMLSFGLLFIGVLPAAAAGSRIARVMGDLRWGMNEGEVINLVQRQLKERYGARIRKEQDLRREEDLRDELREKTFAIRKSLVEFDGGKTNWDVSDIAGEYTHGNRESMLVAKDGDSSTYYFFIDGRLWKWIKSYDAGVFGGKDFKRFKNLITKKFGKGRVKSGERNDKRGSQRWIEYLDRNSRMRAVDDTKFYGKFALVFEEMDTARNLSSLRTNTIQRGNKKKNSAVAGLSRDYEADDSGSGVVDNITGKDRRNAGKLRHKKRRSLFAEEGGDETDAQYEARRKKAEAAARAKARREHSRKERKKMSKALDDPSLKDDSDDPLSGI